ncbi:MAG: L-threonylcarbamoyladenylate synthase [Candidatus Taylorbacteria bacterium]
MITSKEFDREIKKIIKKGGVGVIPTDTLYGLVGSALQEEAVERIYALKKRQSRKPLIVLISSATELKKFGISVDESTKKILRTVWPGPTSVILPVFGVKWRYLDRGEGSIAFRVPNIPALRKFLADVGPLVAPSANPEASEPARNISEAKKYFGDSVDFYFEGRKLFGKASSLISIKNGAIKVIRA